MAEEAEDPETANPYADAVDVIIIDAPSIDELILQRLDQLVEQGNEQGAQLNWLCGLMANVANIVEQVNTAGGPMALLAMMGKGKA